MELKKETFYHLGIGLFAFLLIILLYGLLKEAGGTLEFQLHDAYLLVDHITAFIFVFFSVAIPVNMYRIGRNFNTTVYTLFILIAQLIISFVILLRILVLLYLLGVSLNPYHYMLY